LGGNKVILVDLGHGGHVLKAVIKPILGCMFAGIGLDVVSDSHHLSAMLARLQLARPRLKLPQFD
jgi:hypothetical protein